MLQQLPRRTMREEEDEKTVIFDAVSDEEYTNDPESLNYRILMMI